MVQNTLLWSSLITLFLSLTICLVFFSLLYFHSSHRVSIPPPHPCCSFHCRTKFPSSNLTLFLAWSFMDLGKGEGTNNNNDNKNNKQRTTVAMMKKELHQDEEEVEDYCCAEPEQMTGSTFENDNKISGKKKKGGGVVLGSSSGKKSSSSSGSGVVMGRCCQVEKCTADLSDAKQYHRRHRVCEHHAKAQFVLVAGLRQRFCQQCSRFHELSEFDETRRSCRRRLAGHNERRRKSSTETDAEGSFRRGTGTQQKDMACGGQVDDNRGRIQVAVQENATYKHFQIR